MSSEIRISNVLQTILYRLSPRLAESSGKALLANLRNSIGRSPGETTEIWAWLFEYLPKDFLSKGSELSCAEKAILNSLQLFALYQQGSAKPLGPAPAGPYENMGTALSCLRMEGSQEAADRRFNVLITSSTYDELFYHLRQMIKLLKARQKGSVGIDFARLGEDLYAFALGHEEGVRLRWAREYYRNRKENKESDGKENEK